MKHYGRIGDVVARGRITRRDAPQQSMQLPPASARQLTTGKRKREDASLSDTTLMNSAPAPHCKRVAIEAKELVSAHKSLTRVAKEQFVVEGETNTLGASSRDVEVMRSYLKVAKRSKTGKFIRIGAKQGKNSQQAAHLKDQLEQFFNALQSSVFNPQQ